MMGGQIMGNREKIEKVAKAFLDAWIKDDEWELKKLSVSAGTTQRDRKAFYKEVLLRKYDILDCTAISNTEAELKVQLGMNIRSRATDRRLILYAVKGKKDWKIDVGRLMRR